MAGNKSPFFPTLPTHKAFKKAPSLLPAWGAPSPPAPRSCRLWIASFCQFLAPYLTAEGRIKQSSQPDLLSSSFLHRKSHSLDALQLNRSEKRALSNTYGSSSRVSRKKTKPRGSASSLVGIFIGKVGSRETPRC